MDKIIEIYTDGSASKNGMVGSNGSFGVIVMRDGLVIDAYGSPRENDTTNNRQEMSAILWAYEHYGIEPSFGVSIPIVYSDSSYAINSFTKWMDSWKRNGWFKSDGKQPENLDLIKKFDKLKMSGKEIDLIYVKGHAESFGNNLADRLATQQITVEEILNKYGG